MINSEFIPNTIRKLLCVPSYIIILNNSFCNHNSITFPALKMAKHLEDAGMGVQF